jgi:hypothetical protein
MSGRPRLNRNSGYPSFVGIEIRNSQKAKGRGDINESFGFHSPIKKQALDSSAVPDFGENGFSEHKASNEAGSTECLCVASSEWRAL